MTRRTKVDKVNAELVTLTYGTTVAQLCSDFDRKLRGSQQTDCDKMGYNIGMRLVEDFFAKSGTQRCANLRETAETISKVWRLAILLKGKPELSHFQIGFKIFLNITPTVTNWTADNKQFSLIFEENPLADFVELPDDGRAQDELWYSNMLCGVLRGALEMVGIFRIQLHLAEALRRSKCKWKHTLSVTSYEETTRLKCALLC